MLSHHLFQLLGQLFISIKQVFIKTNSSYVQIRYKNAGVITWERY